MKIRVLPAADPRVETGLVQHGSDWPGVFVRGDNCFALAMTLDTLIDASGEAPYISTRDAEELRDLLRSALIYDTDAGRGERLDAAGGAGRPKPVRPGAGEGGAAMSALLKMILMPWRVKNEYCTVTDSDHWDFQDKVQNYINHGWKPLGGVSISTNHPSHDYPRCFAQAMTRRVLK